MLGAELLVVEPLSENDLNNTGDQRGVLSRLHLQVKVSARRNLRYPRVNTDNLDATLFALSQCREGAKSRDPTGNGKMRDQRVVADDKGDIGVEPHVTAGIPPAHPGRTYRYFCRLINGDAGVVRRRVDSLVKGAGYPMRCGILVRVGAVVAGDAARPILGQYLFQLLGDLIHGLRCGDRRKCPVGLFLLRRLQSVRVIDLFGQLAPLDTGVAPVNLVTGIWLHSDNPVVFDCRLHGAVGVAKATVGFYFTGCHGGYASFVIGMLAGFSRRKSQHGVGLPDRRPVLPDQS